MGARQLIVAIVFTTIFAFAIVNYAFGFASDNTSAINLKNDSEFTNLETTIQGNFTTINEDIEASKSAIFNSSIEVASESLRTPGPFTLLWGGGRDVMHIISFTVNTKILGGKATNNPFSVVPTMFMSLLVLLVGLFVFKLLRSGNPD